MLDRISNYGAQFLARFKNYSVDPKRPQPVQSADMIEAANQAAYRTNVRTPDELKKTQTKLTGLGAGGLDVEA